MVGAIRHICLGQPRWILQNSWRCGLTCSDVCCKQGYCRNNHNEAQEGVSGAQGISVRDLVGRCSSQIPEALAPPPQPQCPALCHVMSMCTKKRKEQKT